MEATHLQSEQLRIPGY